jgi:hypothetical protein
MRIKLDIPQAINHIGGRDNNEDIIYPLKNKASSTDKMFLVCEGY